ncbi:class I SAM-dependent methyltransferase [Neisseria shayeganii]|uniref:SAM-dependent methyltransferase n=1 Tax=Neisseria shayeganii 871 TaxID=1032488 RepID=G4CF43_9NEIS|nr:class I SAM-dependent methyltransferase [Neisseria shayeganii]EGY53581.1 SAM-dependent methyltransferase [Neisseria shayeganii 871]
MHATLPEKRFEDSGAAEYDQRITRLIPGYTELHRLNAAILHPLPADARILLIGVGTGTELLSLADSRPQSAFTALDPSLAMLEQAKRKAACLPNTVCWHHGLLEELPEAPQYDAALCLFVMHFLSDIREKGALLRQAACRLKPSAPLLLADLAVQCSGQTEYLVQYARTQGLPDHQLDRLQQRLQQDFFPLTPGNLADLATTCGFETPEPYWQNLGFTAWRLRRAPSVPTETV